MGIVVTLLINSLAVGITAYLLQPNIVLDSYITAILVAGVLGVINTFVKPIIKILTLPISLLTLGLFSIILNGIFIMITDRLIAGFEVSNLFWAIMFSLVLSIVNSILGIFK